MAKNKKIDKKQELFEKTQDKHIPQHLGKVIEENQLAYSDLVITNRAIPSMFDGLKPVHRRILYTFKHENYINKNKKSALITGAVIGKFHPHGDLAVYGAIVEMTQVFKNRFPLTIGQGNWGNIQGDSEGAMRYTELRLNQDISNMLFENIDKDGVISWQPNYDDTLEEPQIIPTKYPISLINGTMGIAYAGITTKIPSYNIKDLTNLYIYMIENKFWKKDFILDEHKKSIMKIIPSVDLPTGTNIYFDKEDSKQEDMIFKSEFSFRMRANYEINEKDNTITFTHIPIDLMTEKLVNELTEAGKSFRLDKRNKEVPKSQEEILNITDDIFINSRSEWNIDEYKNDAEITLTFKKGSNLQLELIKVFKYTSLDSSYSARLRFIDENSCPIMLSLYEQTIVFLKYRLHVMYKAFQYDIDKLQKQLHLLYGFRKIQDDLDAFINIVKKNVDEELYQLIRDKFELDDIQIEYLLGLQLRKLSKTSIDKIENEISEKETTKADLELKISSKENLYNVIKEDYKEQLNKTFIKNKFNKRLTNIIEAKKEVNKSDLIQDKDVIIMYMEDDTIALVDKSKFRLKNKGSKTTNNKINNDFELKLKISENCMLKDDLLLMTSHGRVFKVPTYMFSEQFRYIGNVLNLAKDEHLISIIKYNEDDKYYAITTKHGKIKGVEQSLFKNITSNRAIISIKLEENDKVSSFIPYNKEISNGKDETDEKIILLTNNGRIIKYSTDEISVYGGSAKGNKSATLAKGEEIIKNFIYTETNKTVIIGVSDIGKAKKTLTSKITDKKRTNSPNKFFNNSEGNGNLVSGEIISDEENEILMVLTEKADVSLIKIKGFNSVSRTATGSINLLKLEDGETIKTCKKIEKENLSETQASIVVEKLESEINEEE